MCSRLWIVLGLLLLFLPACGPAQPPSLSPEEIISRTTKHMQEVESFHFVIERTGAPAYLDPSETLSFRRAEGDYEAPDRARATVRVTFPGLVTEVDVISIADIQWQTNALTGQWEQLPPNWGFNPAVLFDSEIGLPEILSSDMSRLEQMDSQILEEDPDQVSLYAISGEVLGDRLFPMTGGLIGPQPVTVQLWITPETFELRRILVTEPVPEAEEPSVWLVDFSDFGQSVEIKPPEALQE